MQALDPTVVQLALLLAGLAALVKGATLAVGATTRIAIHYEVPDTLVAMTVIAIGTSLPEIASNVVASLGIVAGELDPAVGSATVLGGTLGSSITQQVLLFGVFILGYGRYTMSTAMRRETYLPMVLANALTLVLVLDGRLSHLDGLALVGSYVAITAYGITHRGPAMDLPDADADAQTTPRRDAALAAVGLAAVVGGASLVLGVVQTVVDQLALGGSMVGVVTIGLSAALPELTTVFESLRRRTPNVAVGTLLGSNVVNPLLGIGLGATISTYQVPDAVLLWDLPFKLTVALVLLGYMRYVSDEQLRREQGFWLVAAYFAYVSVRLLLFAGQ